MEYDDLLKRIKNLLKKTKYAVLATANKDGVVSASTVCIVNDGLKVYVQTDSSFEKIKNIKENENVALNLTSVYFKGKAKIVGHPSSNSFFIENIKTKHPETYKNYTNLPSEVLIEIELTECKIWEFENIDGKREEVIKVIDYKNKTIHNIICDKMEEGF